MGWSRKLVKLLRKWVLLYNVWTKATAFVSYNCKTILGGTTAPLMLCLPTSLIMLLVFYPLVMFSKTPGVLVLMPVLLSLFGSWLWLFVLVMTLLLLLGLTVHADYTSLLQHWFPPQGIRWNWARPSSDALNIWEVESRPCWILLTSQRE